jgi:plastocyanin
MSGRTTRRRFLQSAAVVGTVGVAGCGGSSSAGDGSGSAGGGGAESTPSPTEGDSGENWQQTTEVEMSDQLAYAPKRIEVSAGDTVPAAVHDRLAAADVRDAAAVYDTEQGSFAGGCADGTRHHFVDGQTRGAHQSYVMD